VSPEIASVVECILLFLILIVLLVSAIRVRG
jgi:hypothetical protein